MAVSFLAYKPSPYRNMGQYKREQLLIKRRTLQALELDLGYNYVKIHQMPRLYPNRMLDYPKRRCHVVERGTRVRALS